MDINFYFLRFLSVPLRSIATLPSPLQSVRDLRCGEAKRVLTFETRTHLLCRTCLRFPFWKHRKMLASEKDSRISRLVQSIKLSTVQHKLCQKSEGLILYFSKSHVEQKQHGETVVFRHGTDCTIGHLRPLMAMG